MKACHCTQAPLGIPYPLEGVNVKLLYSTARHFYRLLPVTHISMDDGKAALLSIASKYLQEKCPAAGKAAVDKLLSTFAKQSSLTDEKEFAVALQVFIQTMCLQVLKCLPAARNPQRPEMVPARGSVPVPVSPVQNPFTQAQAQRPPSVTHVHNTRGGSTERRLLQRMDDQMQTWTKLQERLDAAKREGEPPQKAAVLRGELENIFGSRPSNLRDPAIVSDWAKDKTPEVDALISNIKYAWNRNTGDTLLKELLEEANQLRGYIRDQQDGMYVPPVRTLPEVRDALREAHAFANGDNAEYRRQINKITRALMPYSQDDMAQLTGEIDKFTSEHWDGDKLSLGPAKTHDQLLADLREILDAKPQDGARPAEFERDTLDKITDLEEDVMNAIKKGRDTPELQRLLTRAQMARAKATAMTEAGKYFPTIQNTEQLDEYLRVMKDRSNGNKAKYLDYIEELKVSLNPATDSQLQEMLKRITDYTDDAWEGGSCESQSWTLQICALRCKS